jgi:hypothetical protein
LSWCVSLVLCDDRIVGLKPSMGIEFANAAAVTPGIAANAVKMSLWSRVTRAGSSIIDWGTDTRTICSCSGRENPGWT